MQVSGCTGRTHVVDRVAHVVRGSRMVATASATDVLHIAVGSIHVNSSAVEVRDAP
jgi:hypothetical protein